MDKNDNNNRSNQGMPDVAIKGAMDSPHDFDCRVKNTQKHNFASFFQRAAREPHDFESKSGRTHRNSYYSIYCKEVAE
eukprot:scaffold12028_cov64-Cylindrotheca_fusiformis.AAC.1